MRAGQASDRSNTNNDRRRVELGDVEDRLGVNDGLVLGTVFLAVLLVVHLTNHCELLVRIVEHILELEGGTRSENDGANDTNDARTEEDGRAVLLGLQDLGRNAAAEVCGNKVLHCRVLLDLVLLLETEIYGDDLLVSHAVDFLVPLRTVAIRILYELPLKNNVIRHVDS